MRIEAYNQIQQIYKTNKAGKSRQTGSAVQADHLEFSSFGKDIRAAQAAIAAAPDVREDLVAPIRERVKNGTYNVDSATFAEKLLRAASDEMR